MMRFTPPEAAAPGVPRSTALAINQVSPSSPTTYVWTMPGSGLVDRVREITLNALAGLGVTCVTLAAVGLWFGVTPLLIRSGSMSPDLPVGALALALPVPAAEVAVGDVVSVTSPDGDRVTHRVVDVEEAPGSSRQLTLKGDANAQPDVTRPVVHAVDRVVLVVPGLGRVAEWLTGSPLTFVMGAASGAGLVWSFGPPTARSLGCWVPERSVRSREQGVRS